VLHIITPFTRIENKKFYVDNYANKNIIWHPITPDKNLFLEDSKNNKWIEPYIVDHLTNNSAGIIKINDFIKNFKIIENDRYGFIFDDDWFEEDFDIKINKHEEDVLFISMKRGDIIPNGAPGHGTSTLVPFKGVKAGGIGFQQFFVKGFILKQMKFLSDPKDIRYEMPDGYMAEWLQENFTIKYDTTIFSYFNYLEPGRWYSVTYNNIKERKMSLLNDRFERVKRESRDISEHLDTLKQYASECDTVIEMGVNEGISTTAFLLSKCKKFICYDYIKQETPTFKELEEACNRDGVEFNFITGDSREVDIPECDLLFIDTLHVGEQLKVELEKHNKKVKKYIIMHDTEAFKTAGVVPGMMGLWSAVEEFLEKNKEWVIEHHYTNNNGLTILKKIKVEHRIKKKYLLATSAFANPDLLKICIKSWPKNFEGLDKLVFFDGKKWKDTFKSILENEEINKHVDHYFSMDDHVGASGGWNKILEYGFEKSDYEYVIIVGTDIEMKEGFFNNFIQEHEKIKPDFSCCMGYNCFIMNKKCYETVGKFDENYFPAYYEDNDYDTRVRLSKDSILYHNVGEESLLNHFGSAVIRLDDDFNHANGQSFPINQAYHIRKWGCTVQDPMARTFSTPFNDPNKTIRDWELEKETYIHKKIIWSK